MSTLTEELLTLAEEMGSRHPDEAANACRKASDALTKAMDGLDALGVAIADAGYTWTPEMRAAYERGVSANAPQGIAA